MDAVQNFIQAISTFVESYIVPPQLLIYTLLGTGLFLTLRLMFVQLRYFKHGVQVTTGRYDDPNEPGDVTHFQALTTALSATVGVGNIAGVAIAVHWGGPGALFWMWVTAFLGMAVKYSEVTLALKYRVVEDTKGEAWRGSVSGGPMYYIERGLGKKWKPLAIFFAFGLMLTSFLTGNAIQANTVSDLLHSEFSMPRALTGVLTSAFVAVIIFGGIKRIGKVTSILAPVMALLYIGGALIIIVINYDHVLPAFASIFSEAFNPKGGVAGVGAGAFMMTALWGVKRGLFSNEAGQGSAPIAHSAAQTDEPVSEGVVALLEPFIDTLVICTMTGLVLITSGVWNQTHPSTMALDSGDASYRSFDVDGSIVDAASPSSIKVINGVPVYDASSSRFSWHEVPVEKLFVDDAQTSVFSGTIDVATAIATSDDGTKYSILYGDAIENSAPLTTIAFEKHLGRWGAMIVILCVALFAVSTAISWSYYGDRCANYIFGYKAIVPFKAVFIAFHFIGAILSLNVIWNFGDVALSLVTLPNLLALLLLSGTVAKLTKSYFERKPWLENERVHQELKAKGKL